MRMVQAPLMPWYHFHSLRSRLTLWSPARFHQWTRRAPAPTWSAQPSDPPADQASGAAGRLPVDAVITDLIPPRRLKSPTTRIHLGCTRSTRSSRIRFTARS